MSSTPPRPAREDEAQPPCNSASVVLLRDSPDGLQVLLMRRSTRSTVLGGAYVFPGGKLEAADSADAALARLDSPPARLQDALGEPALNSRQAAALFIAAIRETAEEVGVFLCQENGYPMHVSTSFATLTQNRNTTLLASALVPWSRWITPRHQTLIERRFDTRFFLAQLPPNQNARQDGFEATAIHWMTPRSALRAYYDKKINLIPPQIISLFHLCLYPRVDAAMEAARKQLPPLIEPGLFKDRDEPTMCYPGDPMHALSAHAFPAAVPTRLIRRDGRFMPPEGMAALSL